MTAIKMDKQEIKQISTQQIIKKNIKQRTRGLTTGREIKYCLREGLQMGFEKKNNFLVTSIMVISSLIINQERPEERSPGVGCEYFVNPHDITAVPVVKTQLSLCPMCDTTDACVTCNIQESLKLEYDEFS